MDEKVESAKPKWTLERSPKYDEAFKKLDKAIQAQVTKKLEWLCEQDNPESLCKHLTGPLSKYWRVRVGEYRVVIDFLKPKLVILALNTGHRSTIYGS